MTVIVSVFAVCIALVAITFVPGAVIRTWSEHRLRVLSKGKLVLTYDDGPSPVSTRPILDILAEFDVRATFFVIGRRAEEHPEICDAVRDRGHEIGSHTQSHVHAWRRPFGAVPDIVAGCRTTARWSDASRFFRPPCGRATLWSWLAVTLCGYRLVVWTLDTRDSIVEERPMDLDEVERRLRRDGGGVVLLHDLDWPNDPERARYILRATRRVLEVGRDLGLEPCTMSDLYRRTAPAPA